MAKTKHLQGQISLTEIDITEFKNKILEEFSEEWCWNNILNWAKSIFANSLDEERLRELYKKAGHIDIKVQLNYAEKNQSGFYKFCESLDSRIDWFGRALEMSKEPVKQKSKTEKFTEFVELNKNRFEDFDDDDIYWYLPRLETKMKCEIGYKNINKLFSIFGKDKIKEYYSKIDKLNLDPVGGLTNLIKIMWEDEI